MLSSKMKDNIPGYPGYHVTKDGKVYSRHTNHNGLSKNWHRLKISKLPNGYLRVNLVNKDTKEEANFRIHRLVAEAYIPNPNNYPLVMHLDDDKTNNKVENLQWGTYSMNNQSAYDRGLKSGFYKGKFGENHAASKISDKDRGRICRLYSYGVFTRKELAHKFNLCTSQIGNILRNFKYKSVDYVK